MDETHDDGTVDPFGAGGEREEDAGGDESQAVEIGATAPITEPLLSDKYRRLRAEAEAELQKMIDANPDSNLAQFLRSEQERDRRMEPIRKAFIDASKKGEKK